MTETDQDCEHGRDYGGVYGDFSRDQYLGMVVGGIAEDASFEVIMREHA